MDFTLSYCRKSADLSEKVGMDGLFGRKSVDLWQKGGVEMSVVKRKSRKANKAKDWWNSKWNDGVYVRVYQLAREGYTDAKIYQALGVSDQTWGRWLKRKPALGQALEEARDRVGVKEFVDVAYGRLPAKLKAIWDRLEATENCTAEEWLERVMGDATDRDRQRLYLYALLSNNFNNDVACRKVGVGPTVVERWKEDPGFLSLVDELRVARKDWMEGSLMDLVARHDVSAVIFANKTQNADRGYNPAKEVKQLNVNHDSIDVNLLVANLPPEVIGVVLEALEKASAPQLPPKEVTDG